MRFGNLLNEIPCWEVIDGTMLNANGIAEVGVRLRLPPSLTQSPENLEHFERGVQTILREVVPQGERLRLYVHCRPGGLELLESYRSGHSNHPALELLGRSRFEMYETLYRAGKLYAWDCFVTLTVGKSRLGTAPFLPLLLLSRLMPSLASQGFVTFSKEELELLLLEARESRNVLVAAFKSLGMSASAMTSSDVNQAVFGYLNPSLHAVTLPEYEPTPHRYPELETGKDRRIAPSSLRSRFAKVDIDNGDRHQLWLGEDIVRVLALHSRPDQTVFGMANRLELQHFWLFATFDTAGKLRRTQHHPFKPCQSGHCSRLPR